MSRSTENIDLTLADMGQAIERKIEEALRAINEKFNTAGASFDEDFRKRFLKIVTER